MWLITHSCHNQQAAAIALLLYDSCAWCMEVLRSQNHLVHVVMLNSRFSITQHDFHQAASCRHAVVWLTSYGYDVVFTDKTTATMKLSCMAMHCSCLRYYMAIMSAFTRQQLSNALHTFALAACNKEPSDDRSPSSSDCIAEWIG